MKAPALIRRIAVSRDAEGQLQPEIPVEEMARAIVDEEQIFVLESAYSKQEMLEFRRAILDWGEANDPWPRGVKASQPGINFHRLDDGSISGRMAHIFHQFGFGVPEEIPQPLRNWIDRISTETFSLQNRIAGTDFESKSPEFRTKAMRHPRGGGYLVPHAHPYLPQKVSVFLNMSEPGEDYDTGGMRYRRSNGDWVEPLEEFRSGDLLVWRYSMVHEVSPVNADQEVSWSGDDGYWIFAIEWVGAHEASSAVEI